MVWLSKFPSRFQMTNTQSYPGSAKVRNHFCPVLIVFYVSLMGFVTSLQWLSLGKIMSVGTSTRPLMTCDRNFYLSSTQRKFCRQHSSTMGSVARGASLAMSECQRQFSNEPWNCSTPYRRRRRRSYSLGSAEGVPVSSKEDAYIHALSSAAVAFAVTRDCSSGASRDCGCDETWGDHVTASSVTWGGCSDNIHWGNKISRLFTDVRRARRRRRRSRSRRTRKSRKRVTNEHFVNLHNNDVGREELTRMMKQKCKCHGMTGSCMSFTCWRSMPSFHELGKALKERYTEAQQVHVIQSPSGIARLRPKTPSRRPLSLAFLRKSPLFCNTAGRPCDDASEQGPKSCASLCCGRGFSNATGIETYKCECRFHWCCTVTCEQCSREVTKHFCL